MKARTTILTAVAALAVAGTSNATIPWDTKSGSSSPRAMQSAGCVPGAGASERKLAVIRDGWSAYAPVANVRRDASDRRTATATVSQAGGYHAGAYVHGGAPVAVATAIQAAGRHEAGPRRVVQKSKRSEFRYVR